MDTSDTNQNEREQAELIAALTLKIEKFCRIKEEFFTEKFNLTPAEFRCMRYIRDNIIVTTKTIARDMNLTAGRITHLLGALEEKKMINRQIDCQDRRSVLISLTSEANEFINKAFIEYTDLHIDILKYLPKNKRKSIIQDMEYFFNALRKWANDNVM